MGTVFFFLILLSIPIATAGLFPILVFFFRLFSDLRISIHTTIFRTQVDDNIVYHMHRNQRTRSWERLIPIVQPIGYVGAGATLCLRYWLGEIYPEVDMQAFPPTIPWFQLMSLSNMDGSVRFLRICSHCSTYQMRLNGKNVYTSDSENVLQTIFTRTV